MKRILTTFLAVSMVFQILSSSTVLADEGSNVLKSTDASAGADQFIDSDFQVSIELDDGRTITNMNEEINQYVTITPGTLSETPIMTIDTSNPVTVSYHSSITDPDYKTQQRVVIAQACDVTFEDIYFERPASSDDPSLTFAQEGNINVTFVGDVTFKVYSYGEVANTIVGAEFVDYIAVEENGAGEQSLTVYAQEEFHSYYNNSAANIKFLENSRDFGVTVTGNSSNSGLANIADTTTSGNDGSYPNAVEDYFTEDVEYDKETGVFTFKSDKKYHLRYSTYVNGVIIAESAEGAQIIHETNAYATYTRNYDQPFLTLNANAEIILGSSPTYTFPTDYSKYEDEQLLIPTIYAPDDKEVTLTVRGYNGYNSLKTTFNVYSTAPIPDNITINSITDPNQTIIHPVAVPIQNCPFTVINEGDDNVIVATSLGEQDAGIYPWDICYVNENTLYINTDTLLRISASSTLEGQRIIVLDNDNANANLIFDNLNMTQTGGMNVVHLQMPTNIELVGNNSIHTTRNTAVNRPLYVQDDSGYDGQLTLTGSGNLTVYSTSASDTEQVNTKLLEQAVIDGNATGEVVHYNLLNYPNTITLTVDDADKQITTDKFSYDGNFYIGVHTTDDVTVSGIEDFGLDIDVASGEKATIYLQDTEMTTISGNPMPFILAQSDVDVIINSSATITRDDDADNTDVSLINIYENVDFHFGGTGVLNVLVNAGVTPANIETNGSISADNTLSFSPYVYTGNDAVQASDFSITVVGETVTADNFVSISTSPVSEPFPYVESDTYMVRPFTFFKDNTVTRQETTSSEIQNNMLLINTSAPLIIENNDKTEHILGVNSGLSVPANLIFKGVNIDVSANDTKLPLLYIASNTNLELMSPYSNSLTVDYDIDNHSEMPTVLIEDGAELKIIESGGSITINSRYGAEAIQGTVLNANDGEDFSNVALNELRVTATDPNKPLEAGDFEIVDNILRIYTTNPITVSNVNPSMPSSIRVEVLTSDTNGIKDTANVTFKDLNLFHSGNVIMVDFQRDTNLTIDGYNTIEPQTDTTKSGVTTIRVGNDSGSGDVTLNIYGDAMSDTLDLNEARYRGAGIDIAINSTLNVYGSKIIGHSGGYQGAVIGSSSSTTNFGDFYMYDGVLELTAGQAGRAIGSAVSYGDINLNGGEIHLYSSTIGSAGASDGSINLGDSDGGSAIIYHYYSNYSVGTTEGTFFYDTSEKDNWNAIIASVPTSYNPSDPDRYGYLKLFGDFTLTDDDFSIGTNEKLYFYTNNIPVDSVGFENGVQPNDGINYSSLSLESGVSFVNNGTVYRNAYQYVNPHLGTIVPTGTGTLEIALNAYSIKPQENLTGVYDSYRGNSFFDYFSIMENGVRADSIDELTLSLYQIKGNTETLIEGYTIPELGSYKVVLDGNSALATSTTAYNTVKYTSTSVVSRDLNIGAANLTGASGYDIKFDEFKYRGDENPYTPSQLFANMVFTFDNKIMDKSGSSPDYIAKIIDDTTPYDNEATITDAGEYNVALSSDTIGDDYYFGLTSAYYTGHILTTLTILPRSITNVSVTMEDFSSQVEYDIDEPDKNKQPDMKLYYSYTDSNGDPVKQLLDSNDYTIDYFYANNLLEPVQGDLDKGEIVMKITGKGNFTDNMTYTYNLQGSIENDAEITYVQRNPETDTVVTDDGSLKIGLAGRPDPDDISVWYGADADKEELDYGKDYTLSYELSDDQSTVKIIVTGINNYVGEIFTEDVPCYFNTKIEPIATDDIYFKPDNEIDVSQIKIYPIGETQDSDLLEYGTDYTISATGNDGNGIVTVTLDIKATDLLEGLGELIYKFELEPQSAGSGATDDFSRGEIHLVDTVYERPDGVLRFEDDLLLQVGDEYTALVKDTDYTLVVNDNNTVTVTGKGSYTGSVTFDYTTGEAGTGTGNDVSKGIIDLVDSVQIPGKAETMKNDSIEDVKATVLKEIRENIILTIDGESLTYGDNFTLDMTGITMNGNAVVSNVVTVNVIGQGSLTGETKDFSITLFADTNLISTDNLYVLPDFTVDVSDIDILHPITGSKLVLNQDYTSVEAIWYDADDDGLQSFMAVSVTYTTSFVDAMKASENENAQNFILRLDDANTAKLYAEVKDAGTGSNISYGLISIADKFYYRPDGKLYYEDILLKAGDNGSFAQGTDYEIISLVTSNDWTHVNADAPNFPDYMTHKIQVQGLVSNLRLGGSLSFYLNVGNAGDGTGTDITKGIIDTAAAIYYRPDGLLYLEEDLRLTVDGSKFTDYTLDSYSTTDKTLTISGNNGYNGKLTFGYQTATAGSNSSGTKDLSQGIIYEVAPVAERDSIINNDGVLHLEDLYINVNGGVDEEFPILLEYNVDYTAVYTEDNSTVTLTGKGKYTGTITFKIEVIEFNSNTTHIQSLKDVLVSEILYQRPDGKYYLDNDLKISYPDPDNAGEYLTLKYATDYHMKQEDDGSFTMTGIGNNFRGTIENFPLVTGDAGTGTGNNVLDGIIYLADEIVKYSNQPLNIDDLELYVNVNGEKTLFDPINYELHLNNTINSQLITVSLIATGVEYTGTTWFDVKIRTIYVNTDDDYYGTIGGATDDTDVDTDADGWNNPFIDVNVSDWFYTEVRDSYIAGIMNGMTSNTFEPNTGTTRAMAVMILYRLENEPDVSNSNNVYIDIDDNMWYADAIKWANDSGVVNGIGENKFAPNDTVTREQLATILARYSAYKGLDDGARADLTAYADNDKISQYAIDPMQWAVQNDIIRGMTATTLSPVGTATRAEIATMINRYISTFQN